MEFTNIGAHCSEPHCKQLDFLPLECKCKKQFCSEHFNAHIAVCDAIQITNPTELKNIENVFRCSEPNCANTSVVPLICEKCGLHLCITHRHIIECSKPDPEILAAEKEKWATPANEFRKAKSAVDKQLDDVLMKPKHSKNVLLANKVQLMRIKNKATGLKTIPATDRVYFSIEHREKVSPVFVSKLWTIGRAIDAVAQELKLQNNNNKSDAPKLRLFKKDDGKIIATDVSHTMDNLLQKAIIINGESLILEYVNNDCVSLKS